jgi:hypothetical protein
MTKLLLTLLIAFGIQAIPSSAGAAAALDIDGDGEVEPLTDGLLVLRHLFGFSGDALVSGAIDTECQKCDVETIANHISSLTTTNWQPDVSGLLVASNGAKMPIVGYNSEYNRVIMQLAVPTDTGTNPIFVELDYFEGVYRFRGVKNVTQLYFPVEDCGVSSPRMFIFTIDYIGFAGLSDPYFFIDGQASLENNEGVDQLVYIQGQTIREDFGDKAGDIFLFNEAVSGDDVVGYNLDSLNFCSSLGTGSQTTYGQEGSNVRFSYLAGNLFELYPPPYVLE